MDRKAYNILNSLGFTNVELIHLEDFEYQDEGLKRAKKNRSLIEYYFTCTPSLLLYIFNKFSGAELLTYLDADLYFFADPLPIYQEMSNSSIAIIEHRYSDRNCKKATEGIYNVGWLSFKRNQNAFDCLKQWRHQCNEWCYDRVEGHRFGDQKYLDDWTKRFKNVHILQYKGANVANWNMYNYRISVEKNNIFIDGQALIFFHFHGLKHLIWRFYDTGFGYYKFKINKTIRYLIYGPYLKILLGINKDLSNRFNIRLHLKNIRKWNKTPAFEYFYKKTKEFIYTIYCFIKYRSYIIAKDY